MPFMRGFVIRSQSGFYTVESAAGMMVCHLRGKMKRGRHVGDMLAVGDWVEFTALSAEKGIIERVEPRQRMFSRLAPDPKGEYQQILIANPDQVVLVFACADPEPHLGMLDRFLVMSEKQRVPALIVMNKLDLVGDAQAHALLEPYRLLGYPVIFTSAYTGAGVNDLRAQLSKKVSLITGPSGVGKSSLLNAVQPELGLLVRKISQTTRKGRHTTVVRQLFPLDQGGYVGDTPGLKALALWDVEAEELDGYFPEMRGLVADCQFSDCTHVHEPGCAVLKAVQSGQIFPERYQSYLHMRFGEQE
jgi:ribosome biogenesis GTPase